MGGELEVWTAEVENCRWVDVYDAREESLIGAGVFCS